MTQNEGKSGDPISEEMAEYLQVFMDETEEQLDDLTETLLVLEREPDSVEHLNEAFRLIHSIKGAAGMLGLDSITALTHHLESRFERLRSGVARLDAPTMSLVLRCIDFLRECLRRLHGGERLGGSGELLHELDELEESAEREDATPPQPTEMTEPTGPPVAVAPAPDATTEVEGARRLVVQFEPDLPLVDLKARLILSRLSNIGDIVSLHPPSEVLDGIAELTELTIVLVTEQSAEVIRTAADVDGVCAVELDGTTALVTRASDEDEEPDEEPTADPMIAQPDPEPAPEPPTSSTPPPTPDATPSAAPPMTPATDRPAKTAVAETMRVDIERLDSLMNLAGELVVNRARFVQGASEVTPLFNQRQTTDRLRDFCESLRRTIGHLRTSTNGSWTADIEELEAGLELLEQQEQVLGDGRRAFTQIGEAIDQLTRISESLQQSILDTRMVPVAPLFNRFKRVVRDLVAGKDKQVELVIRGEKTELDKRMIDELGDPLVHMVRNSIDHGLEPAEVRRASGKPETGTLLLEASHRGNNVFVQISDDGGGLDVDRIRSKIVEKRLLDPHAAETMTDAQVIDYIWHPGFSTAREVTDISGRGVGMDAVKTRITELNGAVDVESTSGEGTTFTIRLPLTLAIINSLLVRVRDTTFSMPISDVREIVSVQPANVFTVHGKQTIDVRGEFIPLIAIDDAFDSQQPADHHDPAGLDRGEVHAVVLQSGDRVMSLRVDELIGSQDIVIKSLSENFIHIRGLAGASILGNGAVCLMLDIATVMDLAISGPARGNLA